MNKQKTVIPSGIGLACSRPASQIPVLLFVESGCVQGCPVRIACRADRAVLYIDVSCVACSRPS